MAKGHRAEKLGGEIKKIVGSLFVKQQLKDPRLQNGMISVSEVKVSRDGSYASIYLMIMGVDKSDEEKILDALYSASGFIRMQIGKHVKVRHIPELRFKIDESLDYAMHMSEIIDGLNIKKSIHDWEETDYLNEDDPRISDMRKVANALMEADSMYIFSHYLADGDTIGSACSLCRLMRNLGKEAEILIEDEIPDNLVFVTEGLVKMVKEDDHFEERDLSVAVDCSSVERFPKRSEIFFQVGRSTISIDHHTTNSNFSDLNLIDDKASSTTELLFELYKFMGVELTKEICEDLYVGIVTDTGNFQYTNTTKKTHQIVSEMYDYNIDTKNINILLFQSERAEKLRLHAMIMGNLEIFSKGRCAGAYVTLDMYDKCGAKTDESDGISGKLRDISGVEVSLFLREKNPEEIKVSLRSKDYFNVAKFCEKFGGGGHVHAAGCTIRKTMEETFIMMKEFLEKEMNKIDEGDMALLAPDASFRS